MTKIDHCEQIKLTLIANAAALQHCTKTAANVIPLPGTDRFIAIGTAAEVARLLEIAPVAQEVTQQAAKDETGSIATDAKFLELLSAHQAAELACDQDGSDNNREASNEAWEALGEYLDRRAPIQATSGAPVAILRVSGRMQWIEVLDHARIADGMLLCATPVHDAAGPSTELIDLLKAIRPSYGAVGSRDVDVAAQQKRIDLAIELLSAGAAAKIEQDAKLQREVAIMYQMLDDGEWADHIAETPTGQCLETAITKLVGRATAAGAGSAQPRAEGDERALFETEFKLDAFQKRRHATIDDDYQDQATQCAWTGWQIGRAAPARAPLPAQAAPVAAGYDHSEGGHAD